MSDFEYDCLQKKRLARQAQYKKNGSKSKKCTLPHEYLTPKQLRERNGSVMTYNLSKPMEWKTFKGMPTELQNEYISKLIDRYGVNMVGLLDMFGVNRSTLMRHMQLSGMNFTFQRGHQMSKEQKKSWGIFLGENTEEIPVVEESVLEEEAVPEEKPTVIFDHKRTATPKMKMDRLSLNFNGSLDPSMIVNSLRMILGDDWTGDVEITCRAACAEV